MSKKENKRYRDADRKTAPKRGGKNRRDYGDTYTYEPKRKTSAGGRKAAAAGRKPAVPSQDWYCPGKSRGTD